MFNGSNNVKEIVVGENFNLFKEFGAINDKWYAGSDGAEYMYTDIPVGKADVYYNAKYKPTETFAVYSENDRSLNFYDSIVTPKPGDQFNGKTTTEVFTNITNKNYNSSSDVSWDHLRDSILSVNFINRIKPIDTSYWFKSFVNLNSIDLSNLSANNVVSMKSMFDGCTNLSELNLNLSLTESTGNVVDMSRMFALCSSLEKLNLETLYTRSVQNQSEMFVGCDRLSEISVSNLFDFKEGNCLPKPDPRYISGADGKWYSKSDGF